MVMNISCKFEKASYNNFFLRAVTANNMHSDACNYLPPYKLDILKLV